MATYWKSIPRKFCDFCKCWITDNKPSVDFHERGKRHQENVKKRIEEVKKKSLEKAKKDEEMESDMKKMEQAAMAAFKKDLQNNPELAARYFAKAKAAKEEAARKEEKSKKKGKEVKQEEEVEESQKEAGDSLREWYEAKSPEGYSYYWSAFTGASIWEAPETFVSLEEQERLTKGETTASEEDNIASKEEPAPDTSSILSIPLPVEDIPLPTETADIPLPVENPPPRRRDDPKWARRVYGTWETVKEEEPPACFDLPNQKTEEIPLPDVKAEKPKERFKEKKVTSLGGGAGVVAFKKRKLASGARNVRQRDEDD